MGVGYPGDSGLSVAVSHASPDTKEAPLGVREARPLRDTAAETVIGACLNGSN